MTSGNSSIIFFLPHSERNRWRSGHMAVSLTNGLTSTSPTSLTIHVGSTGYLWSLRVYLQGEIYPIGKQPAVLSEHKPRLFSRVGRPPTVPRRVSKSSNHFQSDLLAPSFSGTADALATTRLCQSSSICAICQEEFNSKSKLSKKAMRQAMSKHKRANPGLLSRLSKLFRGPSPESSYSYLYINSLDEFTRSNRSSSLIWPCLYVSVCPWPI